MQLKGLVRFFTIALILICLYQLSFTWIVRSHESSMEEKAARWLKANYPQTPEEKYPGNKELQEAYADTLSQLKDKHKNRLLDSTNDSQIGPFGLVTYQKAKDNELKLGLDLQGGISVTMEVGLDALLRSLSNHTKDPVFNKALNAAIARKANSGADLITLFNEEFQKNASGTKLAPLFAQRSNGRIKFDASDNAVISYLHDQATTAFKNTERILRTRIDKFGVASPTINPDAAKGRITIELAGINDAERVRRNLQSTANLQFFEVYSVVDLQESILSANKSLSDYLTGTKPSADTTKAKTDTTTATAKKTVDTTKTATLGGLSDTNNKSTAKAGAVDSTQIKFNQNPLLNLIGFAQPRKAQNGSMQVPAELGYVQTKDTSVINQYLNMDIIRSKFPSNLVFMYGKPDNEDPKAKNYLSLYAIKTLDNGTAELEGEHVSDAKQDYDERGRVAIKMNMDATGTTIWANMTDRNSPQKNNGNSKPIAIVLDNLVYSAPFVNGPIPNGSSEISGNYSVTEAQDLADILQAGKLDAPAKIVSEQQVGPTLGQAAVKGGLMSFLIAFIVIFALMLVYFNTAGWVANIALILNLLFTIGILSALGFTLTAPGIAAVSYTHLTLPTKRIV